MATEYTSYLDLGKIPPTDLFNINVLNANADKIDAAAQELARGKAARTWTDNGDFRAGNVINQRGATSVGAGEDCIDRWYARVAGMTLDIGDDGLTITATGTSNVTILQRLDMPTSRLLGKTYTIAVCNGAGEVACAAVKMPDAEPTAFTNIGGAASIGNVAARFLWSNGHFCVSVGRVNGNAEPAQIKWVDVYEGAYTLADLPDHITKEFAVQLAVCQRHYMPSNGQGYGYAISDTTARLNIPVPSDMRAVPTIDKSNLQWTVRCAGKSSKVTQYTVEGYRNGIVRLTLTGAAGTFTTNEAVVAYSSENFGFDAGLKAVSA